MKSLSIFTISVFLIVSQQAFSQIAPGEKKNLSNAEKFELKSGLLLKKEYKSLGMVGACEIKVSKLEDLITKEKTSGVRFEYINHSSVGNSTKIAVIDPDEVKSLLKSFEIIQLQILPQTVEDYTEVSFKSRSGFEAGCFWSTDKKDWSIYLQIEK